MPIAADEDEDDEMMINTTAGHRIVSQTVDKRTAAVSDQPNRRIDQIN